jgi:hypothetical protein
VATYIQRRNKGPNWLPERWKRQYNVWHDDGFGYSVSLDGLDKLFDGRSSPGDFRACVEAADRAFRSGDRAAVFEWPSGRRLPDVPAGSGLEPRG